MPPNHIMYPYFEYGEMPGYVRVKRVPGGYEVLGHLFPKEDAASGALAQRLAKTLEVSAGNAAERAVPKFLFVLSGPVPRYVVDAFASVFGPERVFVGVLDEPRALMSRYCALAGAPHWWQTAKGSAPAEDPPENGDSPCEIANRQHNVGIICRNENPQIGESLCGNGDSPCGNAKTSASLGSSSASGNALEIGDSLCEIGHDAGRGGGEPSTLRNITAKIGKGRNAVAISPVGEGKLFVECGVWSHVKRRVLKAEEELSRYKCRFTEANPGASVMQKRIFADVAARHVAYRCSEVNFADAGGLEAILQFMREYDALSVVDAQAVGSPLVKCLVRQFGENRVFLPPRL